MRFTQPQEPDWIGQSMGWQRNGEMRESERREMYSLFFITAIKGKERAMAARD